MLPFDLVVVLHGGVRTEYTTDEFLALPLELRVKAILFGKISFFQDGKTVSTSMALNAVREMGR